MVRPSATIDLKGDDTHLKRALKSGERRVKTFASNVGASLKRAFKVASIALPVAALALGIKSLNLAREQIQAEKKLEAVIRATGGAAGFTAGELKKMAADLQKVTNFGDEVTISALAVLATFRNIKGDQFREAIKSAQDMSSVLGTDLQSSVLQLGKALNDPILGITALSRAGIQFTTQQKELIRTLQESGDIMGAQKVILAELKDEFGGAAEEMVDPITQAFNNLGDAMERIGLIILPTFSDFANATSEALEGLPTLIKEVELAILNAQIGLDAMVDDPMARAAREALKFTLGPGGFFVPDLDKASVEDRAVRREELRGELFSREAAPTDARVAHDEEAIALAKSFAEAKGREAETTQELIDFEIELAAKRSEAGVAAEELADAEDKVAESAKNAADAQDNAADAQDKLADAQEKVAARLQESTDALLATLREEFFGDPTKSEEQRRLDIMVQEGTISPVEQEVAQNLIDQIAERDRNKASQEDFAESLEAIDAFQGPLFEAEKTQVEDRGFQARFEGITAISNRIAAAAASRDPGDQALVAAEKTADATEKTVGKLATVDEHIQGMNGVLIEIRDKPQPAAVAG